ncbi:MAG: flagellar export chaperone FliS [Bdellovibrionaceae bacterium]|nr:flagellar export chaperone FliS [Pseudobdellovibrionaceae bacterium]
MVSNPYQKYKKTSIQSASREKLLLMLYEGAIKFIKLAIVAVEKNDIAARGTNIGRAYDIVLELNNTLNHEVGGEISKSLEQLYMFVTDQLTKGNIHSDKKALEDALGVMQTLHTGWQEAIEKLKREDSPQR